MMAGGKDEYKAMLKDTKEQQWQYGGRKLSISFRQMEEKALQLKRF